MKGEGGVSKITKVTKIKGEGGRWKFGIFSKVTKMKGKGYGLKRSTLEKTLVTKV